MQRQLLHWYGPLRDAIEEEQREFLIGSQTIEQKIEGEETTTVTKRKKTPGGCGPFMCTLQAEKLAVIAAHEATMYALAV
eukprot:10111962-Ditylum_brightwellii.AAC.1